MNFNVGIGGLIVFVTNDEIPVKKISCKDILFQIQKKTAESIYIDFKLYIKVLKF